MLMNINKCIRHLNNYLAMYMCTVRGFDISIRKALLEVRQQIIELGIAVSLHSTT